MSRKILTEHLTTYLYIPCATRYWYIIFKTHKADETPHSIFSLRSCRRTSARVMGWQWKIYKLFKNIFHKNYLNAFTWFHSYFLHWRTLYGAKVEGMSHINESSTLLLYMDYFQETTCLTFMQIKFYTSNIIRGKIVSEKFFLWLTKLMREWHGRGWLTTQNRRVKFMAKYSH